jgi:hypothetical protein
MNVDLSRAFIEVCIRRVHQARGNINHCLDQLQDEDIWWTPREGSNSIGILIQHLMGNLRQWIISGVAGEVDVRDRPREFLVERRTPKADLQVGLSGVLDRVNDVYSNLRVSQLLERRRIQGFDTTVLDAIYDTVGHLELHTGQILYLTRLRIGGAYQESWKPVGKEQGGSLW